MSLHGTVPSARRHTRPPPRCTAVPESVSHLFQDHHPDVLGLEPRDKVKALANNVWDDERPKQAEDRGDGHEIDRHKLVPPRVRGQPAKKWIVLRGIDKAIADERHYERPHHNL